MTFNTVAAFTFYFRSLSYAYTLFECSQIHVMQIFPFFSSYKIQYYCIFMLFIKVALDPEVHSIKSQDSTLKNIVETQNRNQ
jgi:xylose isomerase